MELQAQQKKAPGPLSDLLNLKCRRAVNTSKVIQVNTMFIKPETKGTGNPFITQYINQCDALTGKPLVQPATVFVSHALRYSFYDVVVDVMEQHAWEHPDAYFWFDLFTNNQNALASKDFEWFQTTFRQGFFTLE